MLPFILGGIALAAAGFGVKKGVDAVDDNNAAEKYQRLACEEVDEANKELNDWREKTDNSLETYGTTKKNGLEKVTYFHSLICYPDEKKQDADKKLSVDFSKKKFVITHEEEVKILQELGIVSNNMTLSVAKEQINSENREISMLTDAVTGAASGSLAGLAAGGASYLGVSALGTASTGTAIGSLSGAAATNATLAWLGGGSLASGGLGIAGGMAVMGGLVAGPAIAIAGALMASKAEENKNNAKENLDKVRANIKKLDVVISKLKSIRAYTCECDAVFNALLEYWHEYLNTFEILAERGMHYKDLSNSLKEFVMVNYKVAYSLRDFITEPVLSESGELIPEDDQKALKKAREKYKWK